MEFYNALCPYYQNDKIEIRQAEPYSYCQFIMGKDHTAHGRARHPFMTGSGGWAYFSATRYMLGIRPSFNAMEIDPCIPDTWDGYEVVREWRGTTYKIQVENKDHVMCGVKEVYLDGEKIDPVLSKAGLVKEGDKDGDTAYRMVASIPYLEDKKEHIIKIVM